MMTVLLGRTADISLVNRMRAGNGLRNWYPQGVRFAPAKEGAKSARGAGLATSKPSIVVAGQSGPSPIGREVPEVEVDFRADQGEFDFGETRSTAVILQFPGRDNGVGEEGVSRRRVIFGPRVRRCFRIVRNLSITTGFCAFSAGAILLGATAMDAHVRASSIKNEFEALAEKRAGMRLLDVHGHEWGHLPQRPGQGFLAHPTRKVNIDIFRAVSTLESEGSFYGLSPRHLLQSALCFGATGIAYGRDQAVRRCAGGSTLLMQAATFYRGGKAGRSVVRRKLSEIRDAAALSVNLLEGSPERMAFILDGLRYGNAGSEIVGAESASMVMFGMPTDRLTLGKAVIIATLAKRQIGLTCREDPAGAALTAANERWGEIRVRAEYALRKGFSSDPRFASALEEIHTMPPIVRPAALPPSATVGLDRHDACLAAANPAFATKMRDNSIVRAIERETAHAGGGDIPSAVLTATTVEQQNVFKRQVGRALASISRQQAGRWAQSPIDGRNDVLVFTAGEDGVISGLYNSNTRDLLGTARRLGSLSKIAALLSFAEAGYSPDTILCDRSYQGLQNSGGHKGYPDCSDPRASVRIEDAMARSMNLPVRDGLSRLPADTVERAAQAVGFRAPAGQSLVDALAFGTAEARPVDVAAAMAAISLGIVDRPAIAPVPHVVRQERISGRWQRPQSSVADVRAYFATPAARTLLALAGAAPLRHRHGTLHPIVRAMPSRPGEIAKSGTDAREELRTYGKFAAGAWHGHSWFSMVAAGRGPLGDGAINTSPVSELARKHLLTAAR